MHNICCRHEPQLEKGSLIINVCAGCDKRFGNLCEGISTISLWEIIDNLDSFSYPEYDMFVSNNAESNSLISNIVKVSLEHRLANVLFINWSEKSEFGSEDGLLKAVLPDYDKKY